MMSPRRWSDILKNLRSAPSISELESQQADARGTQHYPKRVDAGEGDQHETQHDNSNGKQSVDGVLSQRNGSGQQQASASQQHRSRDGFRSGVFGALSNKAKDRNH